MFAIILLLSLVFAALIISAAVMAHSADSSVRSTLNSQPSQPSAPIINDLARTGALQCPRPAISHSQLSTQNPLN